MIRNLIFLLICLAIPISGYAACDITATAQTLTAIQAAVDSAVSGQTVCFHDAASVTFASNLSIPNTKGITVDGQGATVNGAGFHIEPNATVSTRVTNATWATTDSNGIKIGGSNTTSAKWRVDHNNITGCGSSNVVSLDMSPGVFDHNAFTGGTAAAECIHIFGFGAGDTEGNTCTGGSPHATCEGWTTSMPQGAPSRASGSSEAQFFEDNTFDVTSTSNAQNTWIQAYYGARAVFRFNVFTYWRVDFHGGASTAYIGGRWWEFYANNFVQNTGGNPGGFEMNMRDGSGIIFKNIRSGTEGTQPNIGMCNERATGTYPAPFQIGRGTISGGSFTADPAYVWQNDQTVATNQGEALCKTDITYVAFNRDVYTDVDSASCTGGGTCTGGVGIGTTLPTTCTTGVGFWKTDEGSWNDGSNALYTGQGRLYKCTSTDTFTLYYTPYTYPHPLVGSTPAVTYRGRPLSFWFVMTFLFSILSSVPAIYHAAMQNQTRREKVYAV